MSVGQCQHEFDTISFETCPTVHLCRAVETQNVAIKADGDRNVRHPQNGSNALELHRDRKAAATERRAARAAGNTPPRKPIINAKMMPASINAGVILNAKAR